MTPIASSYAFYVAVNVRMIHAFPSCIVLVALIEHHVFLVPGVGNCTSAVSTSEGGSCWLLEQYHLGRWFRLHLLPSFRLHLDDIVLNGKSRTFSVQQIR